MTSMPHVLQEALARRSASTIAGPSGAKQSGIVGVSKSVELPTWKVELGGDRGPPVALNGSRRIIRGNVRSQMRLEISDQFGLFVIDPAHSRNGLISRWKTDRQDGERILGFAANSITR